MNIKLVEIIDKYYTAIKETDKHNPSFQWINGQWRMPLMGCDTLQNLLDDVSDMLYQEISIERISTTITEDNVKKCSGYPFPVQPRTEIKIDNATKMIIHRRSFPNLLTSFDSLSAYDGNEQNSKRQKQ